MMTAMNVGLSDRDLLFLKLLHQGARYGLELVRASNGRLKRGTVYVALSDLEERGYVESVPGPPGLHARRMYLLSDRGRRAWVTFA